MDISRIRALLGECFQLLDDPRGISPDEDYTEAETALRALKSLFESELHSRKKLRQSEVRVTNDGEM